MIQYFSTNLNAKEVSFKEALLKGLAPDGGLFMPKDIPLLTNEEIASFTDMRYHEMAYVIANKFFAGEVDEQRLMQITKDAYNFEVPLEKVFDKNYLLRLDQGPTASFKDFAARMMGRLMEYFLEKEDRDVVILTATSGDTGSAIANAFYGLDRIKVAILFPLNEVTDRQRKQMTTLGKNINIIGIDGKFDDCQAMVKSAFSDRSLDYLGLSSANSINIGRLIPQSMYYAYAYSRTCSIKNNEEIIFTVPSGNFGDLMGGLIAKKMGIPVKKFVIATNSNDEVPVYFKSGKYKTIVPSRNCISSAMNVGHPSNMARIIALYGGIMNEKGEILKDPDIESIKKDMFAVSVSDEETKETIKNIYKRHKVLIEPHGAVGWKGFHEYLKAIGEMDQNQVSICLETAHPSKFPKEINELLGFDPELSESLKGIDEKEEKYIKIENGYGPFKDYLVQNY